MLSMSSSTLSKARGLNLFGLRGGWRGNFANHTILSWAVAALQSIFDRSIARNLQSLCRQVIVTLKFPRFLAVIIGKAISDASIPWSFQLRSCKENTTCGWLSINDDLILRDTCLSIFSVTYCSVSLMP